MSAEWWVMKVIATRRTVRQLEAAGDKQIDEWNAKLATGDLCYVGKELCEPIAMFEGVTAQEDALIRCQKEHARTGTVHKLVLNADPEDMRV
jgi:hypothetical protein